MITLRTPLVALAVTISAALVAGCTTTGTTGPGDGKYQTRGGGWDNFRAEAPALEWVPSSRA